MCAAPLSARGPPLTLSGAVVRRGEAAPETCEEIIASTRYRRDALGRLTEAWQDEHVAHHEYDGLGRRLASGLPRRFSNNALKTGCRYDRRVGCAA